MGIVRGGEFHGSIPVVADPPMARWNAEERSRRMVLADVLHVPPAGPCCCGCGRYVCHPAPRRDGRVYSRDCWVAPPGGYPKADYADPEMERTFAGFPSACCSRCKSAFGAEYLRNGLCLQCALAETRIKYDQVGPSLSASLSPGFVVKIPEPTDAVRYRSFWQELRERAKATREFYGGVIKDSETFRKAALPASMREEPVAPPESAERTGFDRYDVILVAATILATLLFTR